MAQYIMILSTEPDVTQDSGESDFASSVKVCFRLFEKMGATFRHHVGLRRQAPHNGFVQHHHTTSRPLFQGRAKSR